MSGLLSGGAFAAVNALHRYLDRDGAMNERSMRDKALRHYKDAMAAYSKDESMKALTLAELGNQLRLARENVKIHEEATKARQERYGGEDDKLLEIKEGLQVLSRAKDALREAEDALYLESLAETQTTYCEKSFDRKPELSDFYKPSALYGNATSPVLAQAYRLTGW